MASVEQFGLGRQAITDGRDHRFSLAAILPEQALRDWRYHYSGGIWMDQGSRPHCVGYSWAHWLEDGPITQPGPGPIIDPGVLYFEAQKVDEWPGESYDGTSVRAGAKVLQQRGMIGTYRWAWDLETLVHAVLTVGPVVVGTNWYRDMFFPDRDGMIRMGGRVVGGHAYLVNGVNTRRRVIRLKNSWGRSWGRNGHAWIGYDDMYRLIAEDGEVCLAEEVRQDVD